ncbi:MAG: M1 family aminopeptidase [Ignavibacteriales bacterium]|nr:M1 family aminopeptidase [Ignavibacteriales bacterium]
MIKRMFLTLGLLLMAQFLSAQESESYLKGQFRAQEARRFQTLAKQSSPLTPGQEGFDVTYYKLDLKLTVSPNFLSGSVKMVAKVLTANLTSVTLDLINAMKVDSVLEGVSKVAFTQQPSTLNITLRRPYQKNDTLSVTVFYRGLPVSTGFGSFEFSSNGNSPWVWSLSEPYGASDWWPCKDHPGDKADSVDIWITCDSRFKVGSEGRLVEVVDNGNGTRTHRWQHRYPIATYLISIAVAEYSESSGWFKYGSSDSMLVLNYAIPSSDASARAALPQIIDNLRIYSDLFGLYPFFKEKYGHAQFGWGGGMEHQTMTSLFNFGESLVAHEMAHQWFGDMITCQTWPNIWLNEGFATYCVALYREKRYGPSGYSNEMTGILNGANVPSGSVFVRDSLNLGQLFNNSLVYDKGGAVLHMLRHVLGDSVFFKAMKQYANDPRFRFGTATTEDFQSVCETVSGKGPGSLNYFFQEWIYGQSYPKYRYAVGNSFNGSVDVCGVTLSSASANDPRVFFQMPIDFRFTGPGLDTTITVFNNSSDQSFVFNLPKLVTKVELDPNNWILKDASQTLLTVGNSDTPTRFALLQNYPNPFNPSTIIPFELPARSAVRVEVYNALGALVDVLIADQMLDAGKHEVRFTGTTVGGSSLPSGVYYYRLKASGSTIRTRKMIYLR